MPGKIRNYIYIKIIILLSVVAYFPSCIATVKLEKALNKKPDAVNLDEIRSLIKTGANVNAFTSTGIPLLVSASYSGHPEVVKLFLEANADVNVFTKKLGDTPLKSASREGHTEIVKMLLAAKATVNATTIKGATPLLLASINGHIEIVKMLLAAKADVNTTMTDGTTPLFFASMNGHSEVVKLLLTANADVNVRFIFLKTWRRDPNNTYFLFDTKVDINSDLYTGTTPLLLASKNGHTEIVKMLLVANANVNARTKIYVTPLFLASMNGHSEVVKLLLTANADVNIRHKLPSQSCNSSLTVASSKGHTEIVKLLLEASRCKYKNWKRCQFAYCSIHGGSYRNR